MFLGYYSAPPKHQNLRKRSNSVKKCMLKVYMDIPSVQKGKIRKQQSCSIYKMQWDHIYPLTFVLCVCGVCLTSDQQLWPYGDRATA